jgi:hypothetical protein
VSAIRTANGDSSCDRGIAAGDLVEINLAQQTTFIRLKRVHARSSVVRQAGHSAINAETFVAMQLPRK